jgi:hypothetical protein
MPIPQIILNRDDVFYSNPHMTFQQALDRLDRIERRDPQALGGLQGNAMELQYFNQNNGRNIFKIEWGVAKDSTIVNPNCILVSGGPHGVQWGPFLQAGLVPLAHSHPFHRNTAGTTRAINNGGVLWNDINGVNPHQNLAERLKVFPSAGDFAFCARQSLATHNVKTPYCVAFPAHAPATVWIVNYDANPAFANAPRLHFRIFHVVKIAQAHYRGSLEAMQNDRVFWRRDRVDAQGGGGAGITFLP